MSARALLSLAVTAGLLAWALSRIAGSSLALRELRLGWLALGVLSTAPPLAAVAWRWSLTARRLGLELPFRRALPEVYAAALLNGVLPSGMAGDALRVVRHGAELAGGGARNIGEPGYARAFWAVALERASGQLVLWTVLLIGLAWWPNGGARVAALVLVLALLALAALVAYSGARFSGRWRALLLEARVALVADGAWRGQLIASALVIAGCAASFACSARALGAPMSGPALLQVLPPLLAVTSLPLSVGGFGLREVANGALYAAAGLDADTGIAVATVYGVSGLIGSLPGALCLWRRRRREGR